MYICEDMYVYKKLKMRGFARPQTHVSLQNIGSYIITSKKEYMYICELMQIS